MPYEIPLQRETSFVELLALIYPLWAEAHPNESPTDAHLLQGKNWLDYQRDLKTLIPPPPSLYVKREFLRFALNHIAKQHDWEKADYPVRFSQVQGQLRIVAKDTELHCPASGRWVGEETVSARTLFRSIPKRFRGPNIVLELRAGQLVIGSHRMAARWVDSTNP